MKKIPAYLNRWTEAITPLRFFIGAATIFGLLLLFITPPFEAPDEPVHFFRAYQVSQLNLSVDKVGSTYGGVLPQSLQDTVTVTWDNTQLAFHPNYKYPMHATRAALAIKTTSKTHVYDFSTTAFYSPVSYIPQAIGVGIGRLAHAPPVIMMYLGRLFNLAAWIGLFGLAIKFMPRKKWAVVFIGLIPMALFQAASLSADVGAIGLLALSLATILKLRDDRSKITNKTVILLLVLLSALSLSKQIMFLFLPMVFLLPDSLFTSRRAARYWKAALIVVPLLLFAVWSQHVHGIPQSNSVGGIDPVGQERYLLHRPYSYLYVLYREYFFNWSDGIVKSFFGNFGWVDTPLGEGFVVLGYISMFIIMVANPANHKLKAWLSARQKYLLAVLSFIYVLAVTTALYVYFTPVGFKIVVGPVGRYYYPAALLLIPVLSGGWLTIKPSAYKRIAVWSPILLLTASLITIVFRYYVNYV